MSSLAHGKSALDLIDFSNLGLIHTGLIGGELLSGQGEDLQSTSYYSAALLNKIKCSPNTLTIQNDSFYIYNRLFNFSLQGVLPSFQKTESFSPFYDFDFLSFILKVPVEYKKNYKIYHKWILNKYPKAGDYVWEKTNQKLTDKNINVKLKGRSIPIKNIPRLALRKFGLIKYASNTKHHMNPLEYWYNTNSDIATFQDEYFENTIDLVENEVLRKDCEKLYTEGTAIEKNQVLTLLSALRLFF